MVKSCWYWCYRHCVMIQLRNDKCWKFVIFKVWFFLLQGGRGRPGNRGPKGDYGHPGYQGPPGNLNQAGKVFNYTFMSVFLKMWCEKPQKREICLFLIGEKGDPGYNPGPHGPPGPMGFPGKPGMSLSSPTMSQQVISINSIFIYFYICTCSLFDGIENGSNCTP